MELQSEEEETPGMKGGSMFRELAENRVERTKTFQKSQRRDIFREEGSTVSGAEQDDDCHGLQDAWTLLVPTECRELGLYLEVSSAMAQVFSCPLSLLLPCVFSAFPFGSWVWLCGFIGPIVCW
jgi:hypothetical protein